MSDHPHHESLRLQNFTAFSDASFEFVPGINVFVGENGTGKTHAMKAMYAWQFIQNREDPSRILFRRTFQIDQINDVLRSKSGEFPKASVKGAFFGSSWEMTPQNSPDDDGGALTFKGTFTGIARPVFIPAVDMLGHSRGFGDYFDEFSLDFDYTYRDIVRLLNVERRTSPDQWSDTLWSLEDDVLRGAVEHDSKEDRFYFVRDGVRRPMPLIAEGLRKVATLYTLIRNGSIRGGTTLFWDEPEVNLNPVVMDSVVRALIELVRGGVQIFLATHSYVILEELNDQAAHGEVRYFGFEPHDSGTIVHATDDLARLDPNPILDQYESLSNRKLRKAFAPRAQA